MLIRGQYRDNLIFLGETGCFYIDLDYTQGEEFYYIYFNTCSKSLGIYSSREKAIRVLNEIQKRYEEYVSFTRYHFNSISVDPPKVYQMPPDEVVDEFFKKQIRSIP